MYRLAFIAVVCLATLYTVSAQSFSLGGCPDVPLQEELDISQYMGVWYEIYLFPTSFEKGKCTRAEYTLQDDGHIEVFNRGYDAGKMVSVTGDAFRPDDDQQAKLKVRFSEKAPYGNYWVVDTDYETYSLIYSCTTFAKITHMEFAWILSRNMTLDESTTQHLMDELNAYGVEVSKFQETDQSGCPP